MDDFLCDEESSEGVNHLSGCCCMWKAIFPPRYLGAAAEVVKELKQKLVGLLERAGMSLHKICANHAKFSLSSD